MKATWGSDSDPDEKEAADQEPLRGSGDTLPGFYFISVMETQHSSLLFGSWDGSCRSEGWRGIHNENIAGSFTVEMTPHHQSVAMLLSSRILLDMNLEKSTL